MKGTELMNMWLLFTMAAHHPSGCGRGLCYSIHMNLGGIELHIAVPRRPLSFTSITSVFATDEDLLGQNILLLFNATV